MENEQVEIVNTLNYTEFCKKCILYLLFACFCSSVFAQNSDNWPDWRGPYGNGITEATNLPVHWSESENIVWKTAIHDRGWSTPVIWGNQIWVTTASEEGHRLYAVCIDYSSGQVIHDIEVFEEDEPQKKNDRNSYATPSPVIESNRVYVNYGFAGTACLDTESGEILWTRLDLKCDHLQGPGSSPFLFKNLLILHYDGIDVQFVIALDKHTGETVWRTDRPTIHSKTYTTPIVIHLDSGPQLISNGAQMCFGYEPDTGKEIWRVDYGGGGTIARPIYGDGRIYVNSGYARPSSELWAIDPTGSGKVTETHVRWIIEDNVPNLGSPIFVNGYIYMADARGTFSCINAKTGEFVWSKRVGEGEFASSPIYSEGKLYFCGDKGDVYVIETGTSFHQLSHNKLEGRMLASPAVKKSSLILRTETYLYRIENNE